MLHLFLLSPLWSQAHGTADTSLFTLHPSFLRMSSLQVSALCTRHPALLVHFTSYGKLVLCSCAAEGGKWLPGSRAGPVSCAGWHRGSFRGGWFLIGNTHQSPAVWREMPWPLRNSWESQRVKKPPTLLNCALCDLPLLFTPFPSFTQQERAQDAVGLQKQADLC